MRSRRRAPAFRAPRGKGNLPAPTTSFVGRDREIAEILDHLKDSQTRLLTLTGPPGTGKTRLAVEVAHRASTRFERGAWFVSLAGLSDPALVVPAIAQAIGVRDTGEEPLDQRLRAVLADESTLLVVDNFEQVQDAGGRIGDLLAGCPALKVIVTSRSSIRVYGEQEYPVHPLPMPAAHERLTLRDLARAPGVQLFEERVQAVRPTFELTPANLELVRAICARLDGLPLAIELAAPWARILAPESLLSRLDSQLDLLNDGERDRPTRQQTLRGAIRWSYDLLSEEERTLFRRFAVFSGGATLSDIIPVCAPGEEPLAVLKGLASLADKNLLAVRDADGGDSRFSMLETVRAFAWEQLELAEERPLVEQRHTEGVLELIKHAQSGLNGAQQRQWLLRLDAELENVRAVLRRSLDGGNHSQAAAIAGPIWRYWFTRGHLDEARQWFDEILRAPDGVPAPVLARVLGAAGNVAGIRGDLPRAVELHAHCLAIRRQLGDDLFTSQALNNLGIALQGLERYEEAAAHFAESLAIVRSGSLPRETVARATALVLHHQGDLALERGDYETALEKHQASLALFREASDAHDVAHSLADVGLVARAQGNYPQARTLLQECLSLQRELGDPLEEAMLHLQLGAVARAEGGVSEALGELLAALEAFVVLDAKRLIARTLTELAGVLIDQRDWQTAAHLLGAAEALLSRITSRLPEFEAALSQATLRQIRARGGPGPSESALAEGKLMPLARVVKIAGDLRTRINQSRIKDPDRLTQRELDVIRLVARGDTNRQVADSLGISESTAAVHVKHVLAKLHLASRTQVAAWAVAQGLSNGRVERPRARA